MGVEGLCVWKSVVVEGNVRGAEDVGCWGLLKEKKMKGRRE